MLFKIVVVDTLDILLFLTITYWIIIIATDLIVVVIIFIEDGLNISLEIYSIIHNWLVNFAPYLIAAIHLLQLLSIHQHLITHQPAYCDATANCVVAHT